jgi:hypothetical protein
VKPPVYLVHYRECQEDERFEKVTVSTLIYQHFNACFSHYLQRQSELLPPAAVASVGSPQHSKYSPVGTTTGMGGLAMPLPPQAPVWDSNMTNSLVYSGNSTPYSVADASLLQYTHGASSLLYHSLEHANSQQLSTSEPSGADLHNISTGEAGVVGTKGHFEGDMDYLDSEVCWTWLCLLLTADVRIGSSSVQVL